ncbi:restriction endonuclease subunit S [Bacillus albus]|uniref:restriction endonuclease subunit S n=1 Tax=Bacillus albus TaxID=2026189 RepID=UPI001419E818|nr:restriction endonuclease subunit S [Bacillus albus]
MIKNYKLCEVVEIIMGQSPPGDSCNDIGNGIPLVGGAADFGEKSPISKRYSISPTKLSQVGDIIMCIRATIGNLNWADKEYVLGRGVAAFRVTEKVDAKYLYYWLFSQKQYFIDQGKGATFLQITKKDIEDAIIPVPPLEEQKKIARVLNKAQSLIDKRKEAITKLDELVQAVFLDMFGDPVSNPKGWEKVNFKDVISELKYGTSTPPTFSDKGYKFIRATNINFGEITEDNMLFISDEEAKKIPKCELEQNDIIFVRSGANSGDNAVVTKEYEGQYGAYDIIVKPNQGLVSSIYLNTLFNSSYLSHVIHPLTRRAGQPHLNADQIKGLNISLPPLELQKKYECVYTNLKELTRKQIKLLDENSQFFNALLQQAFKGELSIKDEINA